ncbi:MAG: translocation/assembly module TamB domain-containing protein, partial [Alphaproteobacteria bacterium]|nr:translocation/assembly module TamB domain-containing protein [Alphaproteobacteria bacterium]
HLPVPVALDRLSIGRISLAGPVLGENIVAAIDGSAALAGARAQVNLDLHRIDGSAGKILLGMELAGDPPVLSLGLDASEPTGVVLDRLLARSDRLPLALSVNGTGPLADWHGRVAASAGTMTRLAADLSLAAANETVLEVSGTAQIAPLLPAEIAPLAGDRVALSGRAAFGSRTVVDPLFVEVAAGRLTGQIAIGGPEKAVAADLHANLPELAKFSELLGQPLVGSAVITAAASGSESQPTLKLDLSVDGLRVASSGAEQIEVDIRASPTGNIEASETRINLTAKGRIIGLVTPEGVAVPPELGRDLDWSLAATAARDGRAIELTQLSAKGIGAALNGTGQMTETGAIEGRASLTIADLRPFSGFAAHPLAGSLQLEANAARNGASGFTATVAGSATGLKTGIAAADALLGGSASIAGAIERDEAEVLTVDRLAITGAAASLLGNARFVPATNELNTELAAELPRLKPLGAAFGLDVTGAASAQLSAAGTLDRLQLSGNINGTALTAAGARLDRLQLATQVPDLSDRRATIDGSFHAQGLDGRLALAAQLNGDSELVLPSFRLTAADSAIDGSLRARLDTGLIRGSIAGRAADLAPWSRLAGTPLGGRLDFTVGMDARDGQLVDFSLDGTGLSAGSGSSRLTAGRLTATGRFSDIFRAPSGSARLSLGAASSSTAEIAAATLSLDAPRPGRFSFQGDAKGQPLTLALAGDGGLEPGRTEIRFVRFAGSLGNDRLFLEQPLTLSRRGADLAFSGLALDFGAGRISGGGALRGDALSLSLNVAHLPVASAARLAGYRHVHGTLNASATLAGTLRAPQGRVSLNASELAVAASRHSRLTNLGLGIDGNWNGRNLDLRGQVTGLKDDHVTLAGSVPLLLTPAPLGISVPPDGRLALQLQGAGELEHLADLLPLGEDRVTGRFAADLTVGGTIASPAANGHLRLADARYTNFATGAVLNNMQADLVGDRDRFSLTSFSATDNANGTLNARGEVALRGPSGPTAQLSATLANFRVAARDEAVATASGTVAIAGPLTAPKVTAPLTIDRADIRLPDSLPPNVVVLKVVDRNGRSEKPQPDTTDQKPALPATLDITIDMPGNIFVRGHGLESEWRGRLTITGTSAAPAIAGSLEQIRGSVDLLGKTFTLTRGLITFDGSAKLDPVIDIVAEASASDITAQVNINGPASAPKITLSSVPTVPQDEILARVLFNRGVGQITAAEGLQLAAAAGTLAGGGPGVLDRLRGGLGLDWFKLGSGPSGPASSTLNPRATTGSSAGGTAVSAGKYIAPGVSVGVSQGLSPPTSKVTVEIEVRPHLTVQGEAGQSGSTGIGLNYNYDY